MGTARAIIGSGAWWFALTAVLASSGCASPGIRVVKGTMPAGNQGDAWEAVLPPGPGAYLVGAADLSRRDAALGVVGAASPLSAGAWPDPAPPSLDDARRLFLINRADSITYFSRYSGSPGFHIRPRTYPRP